MTTAGDTIQILTAGAPEIEWGTPPSGHDLEEHSLAPMDERAGKVVEVGVDVIRRNISAVIDALDAILPAPEHQSSGWAVDTIEVGLTLGAKGQVLFISEASAEASIKITLHRG